MADSGYVLLVSDFSYPQEGGGWRRYRQGDVVVGLSDEDAQRLLRAGAIKAAGIGSRTTDPVPAATPAPTEAANGEPGDPRPPKVATKAVLVSWLVKHAGLDQAELEDQTKDDLWALIDATD